MKTLNEVSKSIKKGVVTLEMLSMALFSYNKRAKNMRDKERKYRDKEYEIRQYNKHYYDKYHNANKAKKKKDEYYRKKDELLQYLQPSAIHFVVRKKKVRIYDYEDRYETVDKSKVLYENSYYDWQKDDDVYFKVVSEDYVEKYLFYEIGDCSFHSPMKYDDEQDNLPVIELNDLRTYGKEITSLMSVQMCDKIRLGLQNGSLRLVNEKTRMAA